MNLHYTNTVPKYTLGTVPYGLSFRVPKWVGFKNPELSFSLESDMICRRSDGKRFELYEWEVDYEVLLVE